MTALPHDTRALRTYGRCSLMKTTDPSHRRECQQTRRCNQISTLNINSLPLAYPSSQVFESSQSPYWIGRGVYTSYSTAALQSSPVQSNNPPAQSARLDHHGPIRFLGVPRRMRRDDTAMLVVFGREHHAAESRRGGSAEVDEDSEEQACEFSSWDGVGSGILVAVVVVVVLVFIVLSTARSYRFDTCTVLLRRPGLGVDRPRPCSG